MLNILQKILGTKSDRDLKELQPDLDKILAVEPDIQQLTDNQLRQKTAEFRQRLADATKEVNDSIAGMKEQIEAEADFDKREDMWIEIDKLEQEAYELSEAVLEEIRPEAFSLIRETARRFTEKTEIEVTATDRDRVVGRKV
jgi:preprotein translocase subunit SecA